MGPGERALDADPTAGTLEASADPPQATRVELSDPVLDGAVSLERTPLGIMPVGRREH